MLLKSSVLLLSLSAAAFAQEGHGVTPADIQRGGAIYFSNCAICHGPEGDSVSGVQIGSNRFRRAQSDRDLVQIIQKGIAGTPMPPGAYTDEQAGTIVAYLHSMATAAKSTRKGPPGDAARGQAIAEGKGKCLTCHAIGTRGSVTGPNLTGIGASRRAADFEISLLDPNAEIRPDNRSVRAVAKDGSAITGTLMNQDTYTIQILDNAGRLRSLRKDQLREHEVMKLSTMPSYKGVLNDQELSDVVSYLVSLKGMAR